MLTACVALLRARLLQDRSGSGVAGGELADEALARAIDHDGAATRVRIWSMSRNSARSASAGMMPSPVAPGWFDVAIPAHGRQYLATMSLLALKPPAASTTAFASTS